MQILKISAVTVWTAALALAMLTNAATAQVPPPSEENCKWPTLTTQQLKSAAGPIKTLKVKNPGSKDCRGGQCNMSVEVQSYPNPAGPPGCCLRAEYGKFTAIKTVKTAVLRWNLVALDKASYVFNPGDGVKIIKPQPDPLDLGQPTIDPNGQWYEVPSRNGRAKDFDYGFTVFRKDKGPDGKDSYLACDPYDPLIVNQGE